MYTSVRLRVVWFFMLGSLLGPVASQAGEAEAVIRGLQTTWNEADMDGYLAAYRQDENLRLVFGNTVLEGFEAVATVFRTSYPNETAMGKFTIESLSMRYPSEGVAIAAGTFEHRFPHETVRGGFSHVLLYDGARWIIQHEHTSRGQTIPIAAP